MREDTPTPTVLCLASYFKGNEFLRAAHALGWRVILLTREKNLHADWARDVLADVWALPDDASFDELVYAASYVARQHKLDCIVALEEYDVINAGSLREIFNLSGITAATARKFRDKYLMRLHAEAAGIDVPAFVSVINHAELNEYLQRVPPPWMLKPRTDVSAIGIRKLHGVEEVWRALAELDGNLRVREKSHNYHLEAFVPGQVYHVDSIIHKSKVVFTGASNYWRPPMDVAHGGGVFLSSTLDYKSAGRKELLKLNQKLIKTLGLTQGAAHAEFIKSEQDSKFYFLEIAARVGGAYLAETLEAATGVNLWREWAKVELETAAAPYQTPKPRKEYGGIALSLAREEFPDTSHFTDEEIFYRVQKPHHIGLVVRAARQERVGELLMNYAHRFNEHHAAVAPPMQRPE